MIFCRCFSLKPLALNLRSHFFSALILPWDIFSLRTAATVVGNYNIQFSISLLYRMMELLVFLKVLWSLKYKIKNIAVHIVLGALATAFSIVCLSKIYYTDYLNKNGFNEDLWNQNNSYSTNGFILGFGMNIKYMIVEKPENYSNANVKEIIKELVEAYDNENPTVEVNDIDITSSDGQANDNNVNMLNSDEKPTIIMIMNESLADLSVIGDFDTNEEYLPFINSMEENTIRGYLNVSVFGANTCNTEYEVLTSNTMAFLPSGSIAYQQYMNSTQNSICTTLKNNNYECIAMHPNPATNWNRDKAYALIGFDSFIADDGFSEVSNVRGLASDATTYDKVIELYLNRDKNKNLFIFDVTLQNHGGYERGYEGLDSQIVVTDGEYPLTNEYLSSIRNSDKAFEDLVNYFSNVDDDVLIVMFGDHQPAVEQEFYEYLYGKSLGELNLFEMQNRYMTPYVIWANYDMDSSDIGEISTNYLSGIVLEKANIELSAYEKCLMEIRRRISKINAFGYSDNYGEMYYLNADSEYKDLIEKYNMLEYANIFGNDSIKKALMDDGSN